MKRYLSAMAAAFLIAAPAAGARTTAPSAFNTAVRHYVWSSLTLPQKIDAQRQLVTDDWRIVTRWRSSQLDELRQTQQIPARATWSAVSAFLPKEPWTVTWRYRHMKWTQRELRESLRSLARTRAAPAVPAGFPPHHSLWVCIGSYEGGVTSDTGNGHYGMLQMTYDWMRIIHGKASDYPQAVQEWAAERAWKANGYSWSFLNGQWFAYDNADGCYRGA